jgi:hypothetical protein
LASIIAVPMKYRAKVVSDEVLGSINRQDDRHYNYDQGNHKQLFAEEV